MPGMHPMHSVIRFGSLDCTFSGLRLNSFCDTDHIQVVEVSPMECMWLLAGYWSGACQATTGSGSEDAVRKHSTLFWILFLLH